MAKKRLYGNKPEPCCETCTYGKLSADSSVVLCRRGGVMPLYHSCRRFHYDPLKRTPRRQKPLDAYDAAAFSLSGLADTEPVKETPAIDADNDMLKRLRAYLNDNASPDAQAILDILAPTPEKEEPSEENTADETVTEETVSEETVSEETVSEETVSEETATDETVSNTVIPDAPRATPDTIPSPIIPDNTPDIFEDLKRLQIEPATSSTKAAFQAFSVKLGSHIDEEDAEMSAPYADIGTDILTVSDDDEDVSEPPLAADDLIFTSLGDLDEDEVVETLEINDDGSITATAKKISDLMED